MAARGPRDDAAHKNESWWDLRVIQPACKGNKIPFKSPTLIVAPAYCSSKLVTWHSSDNQLRVPTATKSIFKNLDMRRSCFWDWEKSLNTHTASQHSTSQAVRAETKDSCNHVAFRSDSQKHRMSAIQTSSTQVSNHVLDCPYGDATVIILPQWLWNAMRKTHRSMSSVSVGEVGVTSSVEVYLHRLSSG